VVQHVRIGQNDVAFLRDGLAGIGGRVAVVGEHAEAIFEVLVEVMEFRELVLGEGLGGKRVQRAGVEFSRTAFNTGRL